MSSTWQNINLDSADEGQNWDTVMFMITTLKMILTGFKKSMIVIFYLRIYLSAFLMLLSI